MLVQTLSPRAETFLAGPHLCTLTTYRPDGSPHVAPVRFTWDRTAGLVRVMTVSSRRKARNVAAHPGRRASVCQVVGPRWITLEGPATISQDPDRVSTGIWLYTQRYQAPPPALPGLVVVEIAVDRVMGLF